MFRLYDHLPAEMYTSEINMVRLFNFRCLYFRLRMVARPKHVADNLNKIVNNQVVEVLSVYATSLS
jgi:hypothetical protein